MTKKEQDYKLFEKILVASGVPQPIREHKFAAPDRKWRVDFAWPAVGLAVEIEGGAWVYGRHNRAISYIKDMEKYNALALHGYRLMRFTPQQIENKEAVWWIREWFRVNKR